MGRHANARGALAELREEGRMRLALTAEHAIIRKDAEPMAAVNSSRVRRRLCGAGHSPYAHQAAPRRTNGFVQRLQQTILTEHWRVVFRRHYFTSRPSLDRSLRGFMQFYNFERPHHGYRVRGRTPAAVFHGAVAAAR